MTKEFFEAVMRIPSCSGHEDMMTEFLMDWGPKHGCRTRKDSKGNVYMVKGSAKHPVGCVNHTDTVHSDQAEMVSRKAFKELVWEGDRVSAVNPLTGRRTGLGMDNQGGCAIALAVIERVPAIKAMFPVEEETGCRGTHASDYREFFKDCSFVFSNDSPDRNRATHYSSGTQLYSDAFFDEFIGPVFKRHGVTDFRSEPWTDCRWVRLDVRGEDGRNVEVINAGNGGRDAHRDSEYAVFSDVCAAEDMMADLCEAVGTEKQYTSDIKEERYSWPSYSSSYSSSPYSSYSGSPWGSSLRQGQFSFRPASKVPDSYRKGSFVYAFARKEARDEYAEKYLDLPAAAKYLSHANVGEQSVRVSGEKLYLRFAWMAAYNYDTESDWKTWSEFEQGEPFAARQFEKAFAPDEEEEEEKPAEKAEGSVTYEFSSAEAASRFANGFARDSKDVEAERGAGDSVRMKGTKLALAKAWINAVACDRGFPSIADYAKKEEGGWTDFAEMFPKAAAKFEEAFSASGKKAEEKRPERDGSGDVSVFVQCDDPDDQAVVQDRILDKNVPVDIDTDPEGVFLTGLMNDVMKAWTLAQDVLNGTGYGTFQSLRNADPELAAEFWDSVTAADGEEEDSDLPGDDDEPFDAMDMLKR